MSDYILCDERGIFDPDDAAILEAFNAGNDRAAFDHAVKYWGEYGWALHKGLDGEGLIAWSSPKKKAVIRWFYEWDEMRQFSYKGVRQKLALPRTKPKRR